MDFFPLKRGENIDVAVFMASLFVIIIIIIPVFNSLGYFLSFIDETW